MPAETNPYAFIAKPDAARDDILAAQLRLHRTGGRPTDDSANLLPWMRLIVQEARESLQAEIDTRNAQLLQTDYLTRHKLERESYLDDLQAGSASGEADRYVTSFRATVVIDTDRKLPYVLLPEPFITLRRYQNLPSETGVRSIEPVAWPERQRYTFVMLRAGSEMRLVELPGGLQGHHGAYIEKVSGATENQQHRLYFIPPAPEKGVVADTQLWLRFVIRPDRTTDMPPAPVIAAAQDYEILARAIELAANRPVPADRLNDAAPMPDPVTPTT